MKKARLYNDCTGKWIEFDYDKVIEADNAWDNLPEEEKQRIINDFKEQVKGFYKEYRERVIMVNPNFNFMYPTEKYIKDIAEDFLDCLKDLCPVGYNPAQFMQKVIRNLDISKYDTGNYLPDPVEEI